MDATGTTHTPELRFGADGGNFGTANGYASLAGAHGRFDYNLFADQFNTNGQGVNDAYSDSLQGGNFGVAFNDQVLCGCAFATRTAIPACPENGTLTATPLEPPDPNEWSQLNNLIGSVELTVAAPSGWQHRFTGFDYNYRYNDVNLTGDPARVDDFAAHGSTTSIAPALNIRAITSSAAGRTPRWVTALKTKTALLAT